MKAGEGIREANAALEQVAKEQAKKAEAQGMKRPGGPEEKARRNFTDLDSRIMPAPGGKKFFQAYNPDMLGRWTVAIR